ncbi:pH-response regulator protein palH/rim21 [Exophiala xenobiotica]|nr:pH-response regulator protein palH/rim21 [Exophiala xenobiotica]
MSNNAQITARQLWGQLSTRSAPSTPSSTWCTPLILPSGGVLIFGNDTTTTLSAQVTFKQPCDNTDPIISPDTTGNSSVIGFQDPFYASISPQIFALATATVISYVLVILIFITPRTFYVGGPGGGAGFLGRAGVITGSYGSSSIVGVGRRPLLQKIATVTVAISLTIATADTFRVAKDQYNRGYMDSSQLVDNVVDSLEIRVIRVISDTFLWLAQVQTLIRLFPRHKEKVTIKWLGFVMVSLDTIFSILDSFVSGNPRTRPRKFQDAIPALNYLFELTISLIYASCVIYYCLSKRRFAFWHPKMKNICLVAVLSLVSVVIPVVFFVLDISQPNLAGWGEYIRWVGAAAASVVVWEWVERIESLERDERKDGILGREIFDGDEMLNMTPSEDANWRSQNGTDGQDGAPHKGMGESFGSRYRRIRSRLPLRKRRRTAPPDGISTGADAMDHGRTAAHSQVQRPEQVLTPPSRSDTGSAASTVYAIRYHNLTSPSPNYQPNVQDQTTGVPNGPVESQQSDSSSFPDSADKDIVVERPARKEDLANRNVWQGLPNPFKRRRAEPPAEVADAQNASGMRRSPIDRSLDLRSRLGAFATAQRDRFGGRANVLALPLPVTIIPAPRSNDRTWSPDDFAEETQADGAIGMTAIATAEPHADPHEHPTQPQALHQVVVIPAPTPGRTWSPDDMQATTLHSADSSFQRPDTTSEPGSAPAPSNRSTAQIVHTPRGSLTISESERHASRLSSPTQPISPRTALYTPTAAIEPIAENTSGEEGADPTLQASHGHDRFVEADEDEQSEDRVRSQPSGTSGTTGRRATLGEQVPSPNPKGGSGAEDGRDTGGTQS